MACPGVNRKAVTGPDSDINKDTMDSSNIQSDANPPFTEYFL